MTDLAEELRKVVRDSGVSVYAVSKAAGVAAPVLSRFMRGERDLRLATASRVADAFEIHFTRPKRKRPK